MRHTTAVNCTRQLKSKLRSRAPVFAAWTSLHHPSICEMFAASGVDFIGIDLEHSTIDLEQSARIIAAAQASRLACLPRIASHNMEATKRLLDAGADGIIVPMVSSLSQVRQLAEWFRYPPDGRRSFGVARAQGYGASFDEYVRGWNESGCLIIQIESVEGVRQAEALLSHDAVDGVMVGPYDLSGSLGVPGELDHPRVQAACDLVLRASEAAGKACGTHLVEPDRERIDRALAAGYTLMVLASDVFILSRWAERMNGVLASAKSGRSVHV